MIIPSIDRLKNDYLNYVQYSLTQQQTNQIAAESTDYNAKGLGLAGILSRAYQDALKLFESTLPQNAVSVGINNQLSVAGVSPTFPSAPAFVTVTVNGILPGANYNIAVGTLATGDNGIVYKVLADSSDSNIIVINTTNKTLNLTSLTDGVGTGATVGTNLTLQSPILPSNQPDVNVGIATLAVTASIDGVNQESLSSAVNRLVKVNQEPLDMVRSQDFEALVINPLDGVTNAKVINSNNWTPTTTNFALFTLSGQPVNDAFLNQGLLPNTTTQVYNRTSTTTIVDTAKKKIMQKNIVNIFPYVSTVKTQFLVPTQLAQPFFKINVALADGYSLSSQITLNDGVRLTLEQLIKREVRKAICSQPLGATLNIDFITGVFLASSLSISSIEQQIDTALGTSNSAGDIGTWVKSRTVLVYNVPTTSYVYKESILLSLGIPTTESGNLQWVYDIAPIANNIYSNILVTTTIAETQEDNND